MKNKFTKLMAALALLAFLTIPMGMWGQTTYTIGWGTASGDAGTYTNFSATSGNVGGILSFETAKNSSQTAPAYNSNSSELRIYYASNGDGGSITITPVSGLTITNAVITTSTSPSVAYYVDGGSAVSVSATNNTYTISGISASTSLEIQNANTSNTQLRIKTIALTYITDGPQPTTYTVTFDAGEGTFVGNADFPNASNTVAAGTYTLPSATPAEGYLFEGWALGETTYEVGASYTVSGDVDFTASYTENVTPTGGETATLNVAEYADANDWVNGTKYPTATVALVTFTANGGGNTGKYYTSGEEWRYYQAENASITISVPDGYTLVSVTPTYNVTNNGVLKNGNNTIASGSTVAVSGTSVTFTVGNSGTATNGQVKFTNIDVVYDADGSTPAPTISADDVDITCDAEEGTINYTINNPVDGGSITASCDAEWIEVDDTPQTDAEGSIDFICYPNSNFYAHNATVTLTYTYDNSKATVTKNVTVTQALWPEANGSTSEYPIMVFEAIEAIDEVGTVSNIYVGGIVSEIVSAYNNSYVTFKMYDEEGDNYSLQAYHCIGENADEVAVGDQVVVYGNLCLYNNTIYEFSENCELISVIHPMVPTITVTPGLVNVDAEEHDGTLDLAYENLTVSAMDDFAIQYYDVAGAELNGDDEPDWIEVLVAEQDPSIGEGYVVSYFMLENESDEARSAYFKVWTLDGDAPVYSNLVTITQAAPVGPLSGDGMITFGSGAGDTNINGASVTGQDSMGNTWTITTEGTTSFTPNANYAQVGSSSKPATSITFTTTLPVLTDVTAFEAGFGGFNGTAGDITLTVDGETVGTGSLDGANDVTVSGTTTVTGTVLTVTVTNIERGVKCYYISYTLGENTDPYIVLLSLDTPYTPESPYQMEFTYSAADGQIDQVVFGNFDDELTAEDFQIQFCDAEGEAVDVIPDWFIDSTPAVVFDPSENKLYLHVSIAENVTSDTRTAYFKVGASNNGPAMVYSDVVTVTQAAPAPIASTYSLATEIVSGKHYIITSGTNGSVKAMGYQNTNNRPAVSVTAADGVIPETEGVYEVVIIGPDVEGYYTIYDVAYEKYLYAAGTGSSNNLKTQDDINDRARWTITFNGDAAVITAITTETDRTIIRYNNTNSLFSCYGTGQNAVYLFAKDNEPTVSYEKEIDSYGTSANGGYYLIASPVAQVTPTEGNQFLTNDYDLYAFDQSEDDEWRNYEAGSFNLISGRGYLYANNGDNVILTFDGYPYVGNGQVMLAYDEDAEFAGWNLIGNPFDTRATLSVPYYRLNDEGSALNTETESIAVEAMEGVFVKATDANQSVRFTKAEGKSVSQLNLKVTHNRSAVLDNAIIRFDGGATLGKFQLNPNNTKLYITEGDQDFAVVRSNNAGEMPVNFKAAENGSYTLNIEVENVEASYLHLIDNMTGTDVDLLATPSYSFDASTTDFENRFRLVFNTNGVEENTTTANFAYFNGSEWVVNNMGEATLQVVDMMGRVLSTETISGNTEVNLNQAVGVYMLRLVTGNDVKVQKVVVR